MSPDFPSVQAILEEDLSRIVRLHQLTMTASTERAYCHWTARRYFSGQGQMVELGCWLGSFTRELARGLLENRQISESARRIQVYDQFLWLERWQDQIRGTKIENRILPGEDFRELYLEQIASYRELVSVTATDLTAYRYPGPPIEILVLDVMKSPLLTKNIIEQFFPKLIPGKALVLNQDYCHFGHPWIHIAAYHLRDSLKLVHVVPEGCMAVFRVVKTPDSSCRLAATPNDYSLDEIREAYSWNRSILPSDVHDTLAAAEVQLLFHRDEPDRAEQLYKAYTGGLYRESSFFRQLYQYNREWGLISFDDPYYD